MILSERDSDAYKNKQKGSLNFISSLHSFRSTGKICMQNMAFYVLMC